MSGCERGAVSLFHLFGNGASSPDTGTGAAQSPERGGIQDVLMLIGMPSELEKWNKDGVDIMPLNLS